MARCGNENSMYRYSGDRLLFIQLAQAVGFEMLYQESKGRSHAPKASAGRDNSAVRFCCLWTYIFANVLY